MLLYCNLVVRMEIPNIAHLLILYIVQCTIHITDNCETMCAAQTQGDDSIQEISSTSSIASRRFHFYRATT